MRAPECSEFVQRFESSVHGHLRGLWTSYRVDLHDLFLGSVSRIGPEMESEASTKILEYSLRAQNSCR